MYYAYISLPSLSPLFLIQEKFLCNTSFKFYFFYYNNYIELAIGPLL